MPIILWSVATMLSGIALVMAFFRRLPAVVFAYAAMLTASLSGLADFSSDQLWFWGAAALIALLITYGVPDRISKSRRLYTVGATAVGAVIGLALGTQAAVIIASACGALLGYMAWGKTPAGRRSTPTGRPLDELASVGLPAVVNFSILTLIFARLILQ